MAVHNIYFPDLSPVPGGILTIGGEEAHHALRVKRVGVGDVVRVCNGRGGAAQTRVVDSRKRRDQWEMDLDVMEVEQVARARPELTVLAAAPKGDRLEGMIDGLSQVGAGTWSPLLSKHTVVDPRAGKLERLQRMAIEAMKQCGRAWLLEIGESMGFGGALAGADRVVMADASGDPYQRTSAEKLTLLIGPEGGWSEAELAEARALGAAKVQVARFGVHTMRTETAAVVAAAVVMEVER